MPPKKFRVAPGDMKPVAIGYGACIASDRITVDGVPVGYCYREATEDAVDSGWRFFAGDESEEYADNPDNFAFYDINTITNCDPSIALVIESPVGSMFERDGLGHWVRVRLDDRGEVGR